MTGVIDVPHLTEQAPAPDAVPPLQGEIGTMDDQPKRRGRRRLSSGATTEPAPKPEPNPEDIKALSSAIGMGVQLAGRIIASKRGEHWIIGKEESDAMGEAWGVALAPYMGVLATYAPFLTAGLVTFGVLGPRIERDVALRAEQDELAKRRASNAGSRKAEKDKGEE